MNRQHFIEKIVSFSANFVLQVEAFNSCNQYDINIHAENFFIPILNETFNLNLENLNSTQSNNFDAVDLADFDKRVAFQITATSDLPKIKTTLEKFFQKQLHEKFDTLYIYIITHRKKKYSEVGLKKIIRNDFLFNIKEHVIDKDILINKIKNLVDTEKIKTIAELYEKEIRIDDENILKEKYIALENNRDSYSNLPLPENLEIISPDTFKKEIISDENTINQLTFSYYSRFNNSQSSLKIIVANKIHIAPSELYNIWDEIESKQLPVEDIIKNSKVGLTTLVKVLAVGGVGKSTFLWHLMKELTTTYKTYYLKNADSKSIQYIFNDLNRESPLPILLFLDDATSNDKNTENLVHFAQTIAAHTTSAPIVLFIAERYYRYDKFKNKKDFERNFVMHYTIPYTNYEIRDQVFEKLFQSLIRGNNTILQSQKNHFKKVFNQHGFDSLIDSAFNLITYLKKDFPYINYSFDWEDWTQACTGKYEDLDELFKVVSFFYQFGIQVPLDFLTDYFNSVRNINDLLRNLLGTFQDSYSPIILSNMDNGRQGLSLRHEKFGEWYFQITPGGKDSAKDFFTTFLSNVKSKGASYLFRNISRKNSEFQLSPYSKEIPNKKILRVIESYFENINEKDYGEEEYKMLMEKHFVLLNLGKNEQANEPLEKIIQLKSDNEFALVRLAECIKDTDCERAEKLFNEVLEHKAKNTYAALGLYNLYHEHPSFKKFENFQEEMFSFADDNPNFSKILLFTIERNFIKLPKSTISKLHQLYSTHKFLGNEIAELLMKKGAYNDSYIVLTGLQNDFELLSKRQSNKTIHLLIQLYKIQNKNDDRSLKIVEEILSKHYASSEDDPVINLFYAKLFSLRKKTNGFKQAEIYFSKAFELDKSSKNFFEITKFYREYATHIIDNEKNNLPKAIKVYLKGIKHIRGRIKTLITNKLPFEIELCIFLNEIAHVLFFHSSKLSGSSEKYTTIITSIENEVEEILERCLSELVTRLPKTNRDLFSNYLVDESDLLFYSKVCSILYDFYSNKVKRILEQTNEPINKSKESLQYLIKVKEILSKSLEYDEDNARLIINLIDTKITLKDQDIETYIEKVNFFKFTVKQKARLCRLLIRRGYRQTGVNLIIKFGQLNSSDLKVKNDLAVCYIEARQWSYAIKVLSDLANANEYTLRILKQLVLEIPTSTEERAKAKIELSKEYLKRSTINIRIIKRNICKTYFVTGDKESSYKYFLSNRYHVDTKETKGLEQKQAFEVLCKEWRLELINNLTRNISIAENIVDKQDRYDDGLEIIIDSLNNLLTMKFDFSSINYNFTNVDSVREEIKTIIIKSINIFHTIIESKTIFSDKAFEESFRIIKYYKNNLFNKIFVNKLLKNENKAIFYKCIPALKYIENCKSNDSDIIRMLGRCYMINGKFPQAKHFFTIGLKLSNNEKQLCYSHNNLADWIITKIETEKMKSFGNENSIKKKIQEAELHLVKSKEFFPEFKYHDLLIERLNTLKHKYK